MRTPTTSVTDLCRINTTYIVFYMGEIYLQKKISTSWPTSLPGTIRPNIAKLKKQKNPNDVCRLEWRRWPFSSLLGTFWPQLNSSEQNIFSPESTDRSRRSHLSKVNKSTTLTSTANRSIYATNRLVDLRLYSYVSMQYDLSTKQKTKKLIEHQARVLVLQHTQTQTTVATASRNFFLNCSDKTVLLS